MPNQNNPQYNMLTAGKVLKARRLEVGKSIQQISIETKIQAKYIEQIEEDQYEKFDSDVFLSGFIKIYAAHLSLDVDKVLALYRRASSQVFSKKNSADGDSKSRLEQLKNADFAKFATPKNIIALLLTLLILGILGYLSFQFYNFQRDPLLQISSPSNNSTVTEERIEIAGKTEENTSVEINGQSITLNEDFTFSESLLLKEGSNTISVKAIKDNNKSQESVIIINVKYEKKNQPVTPPVEEPIEPPAVNSFRFNIVDEPVWIQVVVDGRQEFAQILNAGFTEEFEVFESLFVSTGKPFNTEIFINGVQVELDPEESGTASLVCEVSEGELICE